MLRVLRLRNIAIVEELEIEFGVGLNVITGETGAGKSIILKAIDLLSGKRASADVIRSGETQCSIEGLFQITPILKQTLCELNDEFSQLIVDDELLLRRVIDHSGKSKMYLNGSLVTQGSVLHVAPYLLDITGQHSQVALLESGKQRELLDQFGDTQALLDEVRGSYLSFVESKKRLEEAKFEGHHRENHLRQLRGEREELEKAQLQNEEEEALEGELKKLANVEILSHSVGLCLEAIDSPTQGLEAVLTRAETELKKASHLDSALLEPTQLFESSRVQLQEVKFSLVRYLSRLQQEPERLEAVRERLSEIKRLERKYQRTISQLNDYLVEISRELDEADAGAFDEEALTKRLEEATLRLKAGEKKLSVRRAVVAKELSTLINKELTLLQMHRAELDVLISPKESSVNGADEITFMLITNPGEPSRALAKIASGGELSRIVLVLKTLLNEQTAPLVQVFDEVDVGIGGAVSQIVGERLKAVSRTSQVILVTHAPQIAALSDHHFVIEKTTTKNSTHVAVHLLSYERRVKEIARMLAGKKVTEKFEDSAIELLGLSANFDSHGPSKSVKKSKRKHIAHVEDHKVDRSI